MYQSKIAPRSTSGRRCDAQFVGNETAMPGEAVDLRTARWSGQTRRLGVDPFRSSQPRGLPYGFDDVGYRDHHDHRSRRDTPRA